MALYLHQEIKPITINVMTTTRTRYNKSKIMRNAWYLKRANASMTFFGLPAQGLA